MKKKRTRCFLCLGKDRLPAHLLSSMRPCSMVHRSFFPPPPANNSRTQNDLHRHSPSLPPVCWPLKSYRLCPEDHLACSLLGATYSVIPSFSFVPWIGLCLRNVPCLDLSLPRGASLLLHSCQFTPALLFQARERGARMTPCASLDTSLATHCDALSLQSNREAFQQLVSSPVYLNKGEYCFLLLTSCLLSKGTF